MPREPGSCCTYWASSGSSCWIRAALTFRAGMLDIKATRSTQGVQTMVLRGKHTVTRACRTEDANLLDQARYRCRSIPSIGALLTEDQLKFE